MVGLPLGIGAYKRITAGEPEVRLVNRFVEKNITNQREKVALIGRPGAGLLATFGTGPIRGTFSRPGSFNGDLFIVSGSQFFRYNATTGTIRIAGTVAGTGEVYVTWMKGIGYEYLFLADGQALYFYSDNAAGILTTSGGGHAIMDFASGGATIIINGVYYGWSANVEYNSPAGTITSPYLAKLGSGTPDGFGYTYDASSLSNMRLLLNNTGFPGTDYSSEITQANVYVSADMQPQPDTNPRLIVVAITAGRAGNGITTGITGGYIGWGSSNLDGGGGTALTAVLDHGDGDTFATLATVSGYVLVSVKNSQQFYWLNPGSLVLDPLNFAEKESNPDNILNILTVGDSVYIAGNGSMENWYATGNIDAPFAPYEGRVYARGLIGGTLVNVQDAAVFVGNDGIVYEVGFTWGGAQQYGVHRISDHGIEERIRMQLRSEQGLTP